MSWGTLDKGILGGNYNLNRVFDDTDYRKKISHLEKKVMQKKKVEKVEEMKKILPAGMTMLEVAVAFNLKKFCSHDHSLWAKKIECNSTRLCAPLGEQMR
jgi:aryl-alcohol dehydrogenase-like predicted oxidoreductase